MRDFEEFWRILCEAFPESEHRSREAHQAILNNPIYTLNYIREEGHILGFWSIWDLGSSRFMEHLALDKSCRGKGYGSAVFKKIFMDEKPLILEVEKPDTEVARKRIELYQHLGLHLNTFDYYQPPMQEGFGTVPMYMMSWPEPLNKPTFNNIRGVLYDRVYQWFDPALNETMEGNSL